MPAIRPMAMRPVGPIQPLSNAYFRKYETPIRTAAIPIRFSQCDPIRDSRSEFSIRDDDQSGARLDDDPGGKIGGEWGDGAVAGRSCGDGTAGACITSGLSDCGISGSAGAPRSKLSRR